MDFYLYLATWSSMVPRGAFLFATNFLLDKGELTNLFFRAVPTASLPFWWRHAKNDMGVHAVDSHLSMTANVNLFSPIFLNLVIFAFFSSKLRSYFHTQRCNFPICLLNCTTLKFDMKITTSPTYEQPRMKIHTDNVSSYSTHPAFKNLYDFPELVDRGNITTDRHREYIKISYYRQNRAAYTPT